MKILVTGANGYIGVHLTPCLLDAGHEVVCVVRDPRRFVYARSEHPNLSVVCADFLKPETLSALPTDIDAAYYLIHSMGASAKDFPEMEASSARHFSNYLKDTQARQVIYLGGIANDPELSKHLSSRRHVETVLAESGVPLTVLRAAIIIGSGSASFEILRDLVEKLPFMVTPRWVRTKCQPIALSDVIYYMREVLLVDEAMNAVFDIGGPDILSYKSLMSAYAEVRGLRRTIMDVPVLTPRLSSYWLYFITATNYPLARSLVDSMRNRVICDPEKSIHEVVPRKCLSCRQALRKALNRLENNQPLASWKDSMISGVLRSDYLDFTHIPEQGVFRDVREVKIDRPLPEVRERIYKIGGDCGWYYLTWAWKLRGYVDKLFGGVGLRRGRRHPNELKIGDAVDFWRVLLSCSNRDRLVLFAEMRTPGEAWLEFRIVYKGRRAYLRQTAAFRPKGLWGRIYWYLLAPAHQLIFTGMARNLTHGDPSPPRFVGRHRQGRVAKKEPTSKALEPSRV